MKLKIDQLLRVEKKNLEKFPSKYANDNIWTVNEQNTTNICINLIINKLKYHKFYR